MNPVEEVKQRTDIIELIGGYVQLTPGGANWKARCPFHNEKTPSFMVSREKGIWHCFGCGKGGDVLSFVQEMEGMEFPEALQFLAQKAGVELKREDPALRSRRQRLLDLLSTASKVYERLLREHEKAGPARAYLAQRNVSGDSMERFHLGYAPESWEGVSQYLKGRSFTDEEIFSAGLTVKRDRGSGFYDRFRHRIMFPVHDHLGRIVGFGGRAMEQNQEPKYVNTPQTLLYNKSAVLYGLFQAKNAIKEQKKAVVVEGYMDVIASAQGGVANAVASSGTALTRDQLRLVKRYTPTIALAFDADVAGQSASLRGIELAWEEELNVHVIVLPFGKDPDEVATKDPKAWQTAVTNAQPIMEYLFMRAERFDLTKVENKKRVASRLLTFIARLRDGIEQTHYLQRLALLISVPEEILREKISQRQRPKSAALRHKTTPQEDHDREKHKSREQRVTEVMLAVASQSPEHLQYLIDHLQPEYLAATNLLGLYKSMVTYYTQNHTLDQQAFLQALGREDQELATLANVIFLLGTSDLLPADELLRRREILEGVAVLKRAYLQRELDRLRQELAHAEQTQQHDRVQKLSEQVQALTRQFAEVQ